MDEKINIEHCMLGIACVFLFFPLSAIIDRLLKKNIGEIALLSNKAYAMLSRVVERQYLFITYETFVFSCKGLLLFFLFTILTMDPLLSVSAWILFVCICLLALHVSEIRRRSLFISQFHQWLPTFSSILKSGNSVEKALELSSRTAMAPLSQEFEFLLKQIQVGVTMERALEDLAGRFPDKDLELCVRTMILSISTGTSLSEILDTSIRLIQKRKKLIDKLQSLTTQARMQGYIGIVIPVLVFLAIQSFDPNYLDPLFQSHAGEKMLYACIFSLLIGSIWIKKLSRVEIRW